MNKKKLLSEIHKIDFSTIRLQTIEELHLQFIDLIVENGLRDIEIDILIQEITQFHLAKKTIKLYESVKKND